MDKKIKDETLLSDIVLSYTALDMKKKNLTMDEILVHIANVLYNRGYRRVEELKEDLEAEIDNLSYVNNYNESVVRVNDVYIAIEKVLK